MKIIPFLPDHIEEAAHLFTSRYEILREKNPSLPGNGTEVEVIKSRLANIIQKNPAFIALESEKLVGYLSGLRMDEFKGHCKGIYTPEWAHTALEENTEEIYQALYTSLAAEWVKTGHVQQAITFLANNRRGIDFFFAYGFGMLVEDGIRSMVDLETLAPQCQIRKATEADIPLLLHMETEFCAYMQSSPTFLFCESRNSKNWQDWLAAPHHNAWVASKDNQTVGYIFMEKDAADKAFVLRDPLTCGVCGAHVHPQYRGQGIMKALLQHGIEWYRQRGYQRCAVDFETANPLARRFWRKHFTIVCQSLIRRIDERTVKE